MTLHLRGIWRTYDYKQAEKRKAIHRDLRHELDESRISAEQVALHNEKVRLRRREQWWAQ